LALRGWSLKNEYKQGYSFEFPGDWSIPADGSLQIQILFPENNKSYKEEKAWTPELKMDGASLITVWSGPDEIWDWTSNTTIHLINPQGLKITSVLIPTDLTGTEKETPKGLEAVKSSQNCLIM